MASVIDALVMEVRLDPALYQQGQKAVEAANKKLRDDANTTGKELEASGKNAAQFFSQVKTEALGLIGVLVGAGGMKAFVADTTRSLADLGRASVNIGISAQNLAAFQNVVRRNGGSAEAATASLKGLVDQLQRWKTLGDATIQPFLQFIKADPSEDPLEIWKKYVAFANEHRNDPALVNQVGKGLGFDQDLINTTLQIKGVADATHQLAEEMHRVPTSGIIEHATKLQTAWVDLRNESTNLAEVMQDKLSPAEESVLKWMTQLVEKEPAVAVGLAVITGYLTVIAGLKFPRLLAMLGSIPGMVTVGAAAVLAETYLTNKEKQGEFKDAAAKLGFNPTETDALHPIPDFVNPSTHERLTWEEMGKRMGPPFSQNVGGGGWLERWLGVGNGASATNTADTSMSTEQRAFLDTLSMGEGKGYDAANPNSSARGRYQFLGSTDAEVSRQTGITGIDPVSQDRKAWFLASTTYLRNTGRDLANDLRSGGHDQDITNGLKGVWPSLPGGSQQNTTPEQFSARMLSNLRRESANAVTASGGQIPPTPKLYEPPAIRLDPSLVPQPGGAVSNTSNSTSVHIGTQVINSRANDAAGIAGDIRDATTDAFIQQSNRGLQ